MSYFTTSLLDVMDIMTDHKYNKNSVSDFSSLILASQNEIFTWYPIWDEQYRSVLNTKILSHFLFYEIGYETIPQFLFQLNRKLNEIMPYYNELYKTQVTDFSQIMDLDEWEDYRGKINVGEAEKETRQDYGEREDQTKTNQSTDVTGEVNNESQKTSNENTEANTKQGETGSNTTSKSDSSNSEETLNLTDKTVFGKAVAHEYDSDLKRTYASQQKTSYNNNLAMTGTIATAGSSNATNRFSDTPQGALDGIESNRYLTTATLDNQSNTSTDTYNRNDKKTGDDTVAHTGSDTDSHTGTDTDRDSGTETITHTGTDTTVSSSTGTENVQSKKDTTSNTTTESHGGEKEKGTTASEENTVSTSTEDFIDKWLEEHGLQRLHGRKEDDKHKIHRYGRNTPYMENIERWRNSILNIDMMVIKELAILFMGIWC